MLLYFNELHELYVEVYFCKYTILFCFKAAYPKNFFSKK
jgi:hypothetical protein